MNKRDVIKKPIITEKGGVAQQFNQYTFAVDKRATKYEVREAVESYFSVKVSGVNTMRMAGKYKRVGKNQGKTPDWKKAIVTLAEGDRIDFLEGA